MSECPSRIEIVLENGSVHEYEGRMADHSLLWLAGCGFLDDLVEQALACEQADGNE